MKKLGVSIYPEKSNFEADKAYLKLAKSYGFVRVFTSLLQINGDTDEVVANFKKIVQYAKSLDMEVMVDINPGLFKQLNISYDDLSFFHELGAYGLRLDMGFSGYEEKLLTYNPYGLKIEINMSGIRDYVDLIVSSKPNMDNLLGSHNFYPREYTGLSQKTFEICTEKFRNYHIPTAAFITSQEGKLGPWPVQVGLPTLEDHRSMSVQTQVEHYKMMGTIDDILIGNAFASEAELKTISAAFMNDYASLPFDMVEGISEIEKEILLKNHHVYRADASAYLIRSSMTRIYYKDATIKPFNTLDIKRGDILIDNENNGQYKGETFIALQDMKNDGATNVVGHLSEEGIYLLDYLQPMASFDLILA